MPLTDLKIKSAKPKDRPYKLSDSQGLYLLVHPNGGKYWRWKYSFQGKEKLFSIGVYPQIGLGTARENAQKARLLRREGIDPTKERVERKAKNEAAEASTFRRMAEEWLADGTWVPAYKKRIEGSLRLHLFPYIGDMTVSSITTADLKAALMRMEQQGSVALLHKVKWFASAIFEHAIDLNLIAVNPADRLRRKFKRLPDAHHPAVTSPEKFGELLGKISKYSGKKTRLAMLLIAHVFVRTGELRKAEWAEFDLAKKEWAIPAIRMKMKKAHFVPLSEQVLGILAELRGLSGNSRFLFPGEGRNDFMSENTITKALHHLKYKGVHTGHGFRTSASTMLHEMNFPGEVIELQLAHSNKNKVAAAYNKAKRMPERSKMMQTWSDHIEALMRIDSEPS
jgi:integrase